MTTERKLPQLRMEMALDRSMVLPEVVLPQGYTMRAFRPSDVGVWVALMQRNAKLGEWDAQRGNQTFFGPEHRLIFEGSHLIEYAGVPVAAACLHDEPDEPGKPSPNCQLGWVAADPSHLGKGLGFQVCLAVVRSARDRGYRRIYLSTDDWRVPAIKTYLKLGFTPWLTDDSHAERWRALMQVV